MANSLFSKTIFVLLAISFLSRLSAQGSALSSSGTQGSGQKDEECGTVIGLSVLLTCQDYISKSGPQITPSTECCKAIKEIEMKCTCKVVTKEIESIISMDKMVFVAKDCGQPLQPGSKCGSYTVPNS